MTHRRVVITGMGAVSAFGWGVHAMTDAVFGGATAIRPIRVGAELPLAIDIWAARLEEPMQCGVLGLRAAKSDRFAQLAVFAADEAFRMAELTPETVGAVVWGTAHGGVAAMEHAVDIIAGLVDTKFRRIPPRTVPKAMYHAAGAQVAARLGLTCPVFTHACACTSASVAIGEAFLSIRDGRFDAALAGGSDAMLKPGTVRAWAAMAALASPDETGRLRGPFDRQRNGLVLGEGAGCLVLEDMDHALRREATILGECVGYGNVNDPTCHTEPHAPYQIKAVLAALSQCGAEPPEVAYINAHGTGTRVGDATEINTLNHIFGDCTTIVSSTKGATGHLMGACGAVEAILCVQAMRSRLCPPSVGVIEPDSAIRFNLATSLETMPGRGLCLSNSYAFGGSNVSLAFKPFT